MRRGLVASPAEARRAVRAGLVTVSGAPAMKTSSLVAPHDALRLVAPPRAFVSRGGEKLEAALEAFAVDPRGRDCLDAGASTGGFTDCLLAAGAARVVAVDVGYGQLAWSLRRDPRVVVLERTNVRSVSAASLGFSPSLVVADLSFVSLASVLPTLALVPTEGADFILLVKPQFESGYVGPGGVVREPREWRLAMERVARASRASGLEPQGGIASPITGPAGNVEFLLHAVRGGDPRHLDLDAAIAQGSDLLR